MIKLSLCKSMSYQRTDLEEICSWLDQVRPVVSHLKVCLPKKPPIPNNICDYLGGPQIQFCKESLFVQYYNNKHFSLLSAPTPIKSLPEREKFLSSLISPCIKKGDCYDAWKFVSLHCANGISHIKGIGFDQEYSPAAHSDSFIINVYVASMHRLAASI